MLKVGLLLLSALCLVSGVGVMAVPKVISKVNMALNRVYNFLDEKLMRYRFLFGVALFVVGYLFFRLALLMPQLRG